jgi:hypothetical protein
MALFGLGRKPTQFSFKCSDCGDIHHGSPSYGYKRPGNYLAVSAENREKFASANDDLCKILPTDDGEVTEAEYYIRCTLDIPIHGAVDPFLWGVWMSQSKESFSRYIDTFSQNQEGDGSFGWLEVPITYYKAQVPNTTNLAADVVWGNERPKVILHECDHPLYIDQHNGISWDKAIEIATPLMHGS